MKKKGFKYTPGQYIFLNLPCVSLLEWHAFTISSCPSQVKGKYQVFSVHVKACGDYTRKLVHLATTNPNVITSRIALVDGNVTLLLLLLLARMFSPLLLFLQGPYGSLVVNPLVYERIVFVAGGIGITPLLPIINQLLNAPSIALRRMDLHWAIKERGLCDAILQGKTLCCSFKNEGLEN